MAVHILIVDPDPGASAATRALLEATFADAAIVCSLTPAAARIAAQAQPPDLLVIDPGIYATDALRLIDACSAQQPPTLTLILTSVPLGRHQRQRHTIAAYLEKPVATDTLLAAFDHLLTTARIRTQSTPA